ncbi:MAG: inositol monophosphatase family protein [Armatimonadota bacterium]
MNEPLNIESLKQLVVEAGKTALKSRSTMATEIKPDNTVVTNVDRDVEEFLWSELSRDYPDFGFVGEEYGRRGPLNTPFWACDPIDGTTNYVHNLPHWAVSLALIHSGSPQIGVLYIPVLEELFWAVRGQGAFCNGVRLSARDQNTLDQEDTFCLSSESVKALPVSSLPASLRGLGSIATEMVYVAKNRFCGAVGMNPGLVDIAAAVCICQEAGCEVRRLSGEPLNIQQMADTGKLKGPFICAPPQLLRYASKLLNLEG